ncbi:TPA: Fe-S cluster assembly ATPase SufC [Candidatus Collierbacteria bacterium]|uniref:FeS assembly ATPase SufC n=1 Tax=Candidatus Collierbacteria bacterium GW2011_GWA2_42_17 TaxID=1618378 RepID=A0A0G0Z2D1_9BACT|nr:MAG: FeS assembly ATPase SufC [Candidatus Collierbacteria bacterium GW2011_GWB2_42_12]KKS42939.1 MAG: FeS assembly ATPase SufC [Candidatus Collierbacteria bacterium GW2011_GWA2_42_17]KKS61700.1 MAG: FeS assembly ATPase SufC [Candidatus Collierbacteria bacterium GW2011_GWF1_42_50]KKS62735.1 MAG: FeS assembly ATPase SufC [Candidatus Collierbacteria bacterium GW2011_GWE2_42_48]KKS62859.1 MAG: FeS assembly ATPase SufC [Candidatus Collierbacteria bacterium GW2011_GWD2_42_50]KKS64390.1 MAG: FeS a
MLKVKNLKVRVEEKEILKGVDLSIKQGEVVALMGPNGSGKSSLASAIIGNPKYEVIEGKIAFEGKDLSNLTPDERANKGIYLAFQYPAAIPGVTVREMLLSALRTRNKEVIVSALDLKKTVEIEAEKLHLSTELLSRGLNEGFSGGEKKKMEILQMRVLKPKLLIMDEIDSGLDIDALATIAQNVAEMVKEQKMSVLVITHYQRILNYLTPDVVAVMKDGVIVEQGGKEIVDRLEKSGYR